MSFIYLTPIFIYFPVILSGVETQPVLTVLCSLFAFLRLNNGRSLFSFIVLFCVTLLCALLYSLFKNQLSNIGFVMQLLIGPFFLLALFELKAKHPRKATLALIAIIYLFIGILELFFSEIYASVASILLDRATITDGHRGLSFLTPEPSYASISIVYLLMLTRWSSIKSNESYAAIECVFIVCLLLTLSTYAFLMLLLLIFIRWPKVFITSFGFLLLALSSIGYVALGNEDSIRVVVAFSRLLSVDSSDLLFSLTTLDSSLGSRITTNIASLLTPFHSPLGLGLNCGSVPLALELAGYDFALRNPVIVGVMESGCLKPQAYLPSVALAFGALSLIFISSMVSLILYTARFRLNNRLWHYPLVVSFLLLIVQGQLSNPAAWFMIYFAFSSEISFDSHKNRLYTKTI